MAQLAQTPSGLVARGAAVRVAAYGAGVLVSVAAAALLFRHLGVEDSGRYYAVISLVTIAVGLTDGGLTPLATRELSIRPKGAGGGLLDELLGLRVAFGTLGVLAAGAVAALFGWGPALVLGAVLAGAGSVMAAVASNVGALLGSQMRWGAVAGVDLFRSVVAAATLAALVLAGAGMLPLLAVPLAGGVAALALVTRLTGHAPRPRVRAGMLEWRRRAPKMLALAAATAVTVVYLRVAMVVTSAVAPASESGLFAAAFRVVEVLSLVPLLVAGAALPLLAREAGGRGAAHRALARRTVAAGAALGVVAAGALALAAPLVIAVVGGSDFRGSVPVLRIEAIALGLNFVTAAFAVSLLSLERYGAMLIAGLAGVVVAVGGTLALAPSMGAEGSALASVAAELACAATAATLFVRGHREVVA